MTKELKYPKGFIKPDAVELDSSSIQGLIDKILADEELTETATGDALVRHIVEEEGVYEIVEVYRLEGRSENIMGK